MVEPVKWKDATTLTNLTGIVISIITNTERTKIMASVLGVSVPEMFVIEGCVVATTIY